MLENVIFCPVKQTGRQIKELDLSVFDLVSELGNINIVDFVYQNKTHIVNMDSVRYHVLKNNPSCSCCGIKITRCFLEKDVQQTKKQNKDLYHIQFYAETGKDQCPSHLVLMTHDHIIAKTNNGPDSIENSQTLCYNCNCVKGVSNFTIEQIQSIIFPAYRSYRSSIMLNKAKKLVAPLRLKIKSNVTAIDSITKGLNSVVDKQRVAGMQEKILDCQNENKELLKKCDQIELEAQITGILVSLK